MPLMATAFKEKPMQERTIKEVIDTKTGEIIDADVFFDRPEGEIFADRRLLEENNQSNKDYLICQYCHQRVRVRGTPLGAYSMHFAHLHDSDDCPIKTNTHCTKEEILIMKYNGVKESDRHKDAKSRVEQSLKVDIAFSNVESEATFHHRGGQKEWRRPDVSAQFKGYPFVCEVQLSTTFLSVVVDRDTFYRKNSTFILWVFDQFEPANLKFADKDIIYANNYNAFVVNEETLKSSQEKNEFRLHCYYCEPVLIRGEIKPEWRDKEISFHELTFDYTNFKFYYFDYKSTYDELNSIQNRDAPRFTKPLPPPSPNQKCLYTPQRPQVTDSTPYVRPSLPCEFCGKITAVGDCWDYNGKTKLCKCNTCRDAGLYQRPQQPTT